MNSQGDERVFVRRISSLAQAVNHCRRDAVDTEGDKLVAIGRLDALRTHSAMNAESTRKMRNAISLSASRSLRFSFFICWRNREADVLYRHGELLFLVDGESERLISRGNFGSG